MFVGVSPAQPAACLLSHYLNRSSRSVQLRGIVFSMHLQTALDPPILHIILYSDFSDSVWAGQIVVCVLVSFCFMKEQLQEFRDDLGVHVFLQQG